MKKGCGKVRERKEGRERVICEEERAEGIEITQEGET